MNLQKHIVILSLAGAVAACGGEGRRADYSGFEPVSKTGTKTDKRAKDQTAVVTTVKGQVELMDQDKLAAKVAEEVAKQMASQNLDQRRQPVRVSRAREFLVRPEAISTSQTPQPDSETVRVTILNNGSPVFSHQIHTTGLGSYLNGIKPEEQLANGLEDAVKNAMQNATSQGNYLVFNLDAKVTDMDTPEQIVAKLFRDSGYALTMLNTEVEAAMQNRDTAAFVDTDCNTIVKVSSINLHRDLDDHFYDGNSEVTVYVQTDTEHGAKTAKGKIAVNDKTLNSDVTADNLSKETISINGGNFGQQEYDAVYVSVLDDDNWGDAFLVENKEVDTNHLSWTVSVAASSNFNSTAIYTASTTVSTSTATPAKDENGNDIQTVEAQADADVTLSFERTCHRIQLGAM